MLPSCDNSPTWLGTHEPFSNWRSHTWELMELPLSRGPHSFPRLLSSFLAYDRYGLPNWLQLFHLRRSAHYQCFGPTRRLAWLISQLPFRPQHIPPGTRPSRAWFDPREPTPKRRPNPLLKRGSRCRLLAAALQPVRCRTRSGSASCIRACYQRGKKPQEPWRKRPVTGCETGVSGVKPGDERRGGSGDAGMARRIQVQSAGAGASGGAGGQSRSATG